MDTRPVHVLATTDEGTRSALDAAGKVARARGSRVMVIVPLVVSYGLPLDHPDDDPRIVADRYRAVVAASGTSATVLVCCCREPRHVLGRMLLDRAQVIVGGRRRRWWPTREERLAHALACEGHDVIFSDVTNGHHSDMPVSA